MPGEVLCHKASPGVRDPEELRVGVQKAVQHGLRDPESNGLGQSYGSHARVRDLEGRGLEMESRPQGVQRAGACVGRATAKLGLGAKSM